MSASASFHDWRKSARLAFRRYRSKSNWRSAKDWLSENYTLVVQFFEDERVRDYIFQPFRELFHSFQNSTEGRVKATITQVALANAVVAGLPGKLGIGVYVCMALEAWMAMRIARFVGVEIKSTADLFKYMGVLGGVTFTIGWLFTHLLRGAFSLISVLPAAIPATFVAELLVTNFVGIFFWVAFQEAAEQRSFQVPIRMMRGVYSTSIDLLTFQLQTIKQSLSPDNLKLVGGRLAAWLKGDIAVLDPARKRGQVLVVGLIAALMQGRHEELNGPLGEIFLQSIRDRWSAELGDASVEEIADHMALYDSEQLTGVVSLIKGKMFEHLVAVHENNDGDDWSARLHEDETYPGSDVIFTNFETGEEIEFSIKAVSNSALIEKALLRYPDIPIIANSEMSERFGDLETVMTTELSEVELEEYVTETLDGLRMGNSNVVEGIGAGTAGAFTARMWPFAVAYIRGIIDRDELVFFLQKMMGETGVVLAGRIAFGAVLGPVYVWYLLAKGVIQVVPSGDERKANKPRRLEYVGKFAQANAGED